MPTKWICRLYALPERWVVMHDLPGDRGAKVVAGPFPTIQLARQALAAIKGAKSA